MPIDIYWEVKNILADADSMIAAGEDQNLILEVYRTVFSKVVRYTLNEKDRNWLYAMCRKL